MNKIPSKARIGSLPSKTGYSPAKRAKGSAYKPNSAVGQARDPKFRLGIPPKVDVRDPEASFPSEADKTRIRDKRTPFSSRHG